MKRKILTVIIVCMLTCVMCMVLFACNKTQNQNEPDSVDSAIGGVYNDREGQFENYMASTEFSFGEMRWEYMNLYFNNQSYQGESELIFSNNKARDNTLDKLQEYCLKYQTHLYESIPEEYVKIEFDVNKDDVKVTTNFYHDYMTDKAKDEVFDAYEVGNYVLDPSTYTSSSEYMYKDMIHDVYKIKTYYFVFVSAAGMSMIYWGDPHGCQSSLNFYTLIYGEDWERVMVLNTKVHISYGHLVEELFEVTTTEERHQLAQYYQAIHREICMAWYYSGKGQNYFEWYDERNFCKKKARD